MVNASGGSQGGDSSYAVVLDSCTDVTIRRCQLNPGEGGYGEDGNKGSDVATAAIEMARLREVLPEPPQREAR